MIARREITIDQEFKRQLFPLDPVEYSFLEQSIVNEGCRDCLTVWDNGNDLVLVDGHNRYEICTANGIKYETRVVEFESRDAVSDWIDKNQAARRNCKPEDYKILTGRIYNRRKKSSSGRTDRDLSGNQVDNPKTAEVVADELNLSPATVVRNGQRAEVYDAMLEVGDNEAAEAAKTAPQSVIADVKNEPPAIASDKLKTSRQSVNTGEIEWYTPREFIEMASSVMGGIDLDPASCKQAQKTVQAEKYYDVSADGLSKDWTGKVWLNPPYKSGMVEKFIDKLIESRPAVTQAIVLVNNGTETRWFQKLLSNSKCVCFPAKRIAFINSNGQQCDQPNHGQAFFYFGSRVKSFVNEFSAIGVCLEVVR